MPLIVGLLAANAILHGIVTARFGMRNNNLPFFVFALIYAALALAVLRSVPNVLWAVLGFSTIGFVGLSVTFNKPIRDKTLDKVIWVLDASTIIATAYLLFVASR